MKTKGFIFLMGFTVLVFKAGLAQENDIDKTLAYQYFQEALTISSKDNALLWGEKLYGPMLFVNPKNRVIVANQQDKEGYLKREGNIYLGKLPKKENIANTAFTWAGYKWTMITWPLPENEFERANLMMHELFHRIQDKIGFPAKNPINNHLDEKDGRILIQLEWQALKQALNKTGEKQITDIKSALLFREYRRKIYPNAHSLESALELNEGLAEYTGVKLSGRDETAIRIHLSQKVDDAKNLPTFVRSFAYISGPIYGILLDQTRVDWRKNLSKSIDLADMLASVYQIEIPQNLEKEVESLSKFYDGDEIKKHEDERERERQKRIENYRKKFVEGPIVIIPLRNMNVQFDPRNLQPLDNLGTVYPNIRISDNWGILTVINGALMSSNWTNIYVSALNIPLEIIDTNHIKGDGWKLELNEGWKLVPSERKGDYLLKEIN